MQNTPVKASLKNEIFIQLLGGFAISVGGKPLPAEQLKSRRVRSLIKLLALSPAHRLQRDQIIDRLWPDSDIQASANNFHQTLFAARRVLEGAGAGGLALEEGFLRLEGAAGQSWQVDVEQFEAAAASAKDSQDPNVFQLALALYRGDLLPDDLYEEWTVERRNSLHQTYLKLLLDLARLYERHANYAAGIESLLRLLAADRSLEEAHTTLMRLYALNDQRQQALRQYQTLREVLQAELGVEPAQASTQLYEAIQSGKFPPRTGADLPRAKSLLPTALPTGTVTFLFTDIEGSSSLWEQHPQVMPAVVARHHVILEETIAANGGVVFKVVGDSFQAVFRLANQGVAAAVAAQRALQAEPWTPAVGGLRVRMGLHTGPAELAGEDYTVSHTLNRASRVMGAGFGGQILLSNESASLILSGLAARELPETFSLQDLGEHHLKGLQIPEHLFQVCGPGLSNNFPRLPSAIGHKHNLPAQLTSWIGREKESNQVSRLVRDQRLVTLTGSGGTGKTRLALRVAEGLLPDFPDGVFLVELAPLSDPDLVPQACFQTLELVQQSGIPPTTALIHFLEKKHLLLVLDNCEHVLRACIQLADALLKGCSRLHILATSREVLSIPGESAFRVPSLTYPDPGVLPDPEYLLSFEAVRLFVERAKEVAPNFGFTLENSPLVTQICLRLDGIPLAIELAAARTRLLSAQQIAARLENSFRLLTGGSKAVLPRQQTLKATIDWSYDLLTPKERLLLQRLSVFSGGWTLEGAEAVCSDDASQESCAEEPLNDLEIMDLLAQLVDKSLVIAESHSNGIRYHMLETVRQYGHERLSETGCSQDLRDRHLAYYVRLSIEAEPHLRATGMLEWLERLDQELDNLRAALDWSLAGQVVLGLKLAANLMWFWHSGSRFEENVARFGKLLDAEAQQRGDQPLQGERALQRARALRLFGWNVRYTNHKLAEEEDAFYQESIAILRTLGPAARDELGISLTTRFLLTSRPDPDQPSELRDEMLEIIQHNQDKLSLAEYFYGLAGNLKSRGRLEEAQAMQERSLALCQEMGDLNGMCSRSFELSYFAWYAGNHPRADALLQQSLEYGLKVKARWFVPEIQVEFSNRALARGDYQESTRLAEESLAKIRDINYTMRIDLPLATLQKISWSQGDVERSMRYGQERLELFKGVNSFFQVVRDISARLYLGRAAISQGDLTQAERLLKQSSDSDLWKNISYYWNLEIELMLAWIALLSQQGEHLQAARLMGAVDALYQQTKISFSPRERSEYAENLALSRTALGEEAFTMAFAAGHTMTLEQAIAWANDQ